MKEDKSQIRERALKSVVRLGRLMSLNAPALVKEREEQLLDRYLEMLGDEAAAAMVDLPRMRLRVLGQEAMVRAWEERCRSCQHYPEGDYDDVPSWQKWCSRHFHEERPVLLDCPDFDDSWPS